ncbi:probable zinc metalloprotease EGY2, chloroplastic isoform X1 [Selaginella moellendorffii]|uniref:probable zinc metalloprotease EGY2, chloroplastic isoform X1 n=1 Tax=Selaginella moellendorffii TaxID=88036 RepID=UPI000D1D11FD|nr:probable zinc metalloprotease EGY2, chloroplastic isoform X1 [Selaginella moellendorffii]|eukprot:XP_002971707.2 probable zinc metalloprotease EGY2, chloroplastic isoform X1 [Selaginella moellendorffii]
MAAAIASWLWRPPLFPRHRSYGGIDLRIRRRCAVARKWRPSPRPLIAPCRASPDDKEESSKEDKGVETGGSDPPAEVSEPSKVISGSPLPGVKAPLESIKIPKEVLETIRNQIFGFDTFFATSQEYYEAGVIFRGNMRGEPAASHAKLSSRLQEKFGDEYQLFFISDPEGDKPLAAIVRNTSLQTEPGAIPDWFTVSAFGLVSLVTIFLRNSPALQLSLLTGSFTFEQVLDAVPRALVTLSVLLAHEAGHYVAAKRNGASIGLPYFIPSWQLGSFGGITRVTSVLKNRSELAEIAASGPLTGAVLALAIIVVGLLLTPEKGDGLLVSSSIFHDSLLVGGIAKLLLGDALKEGSTISINPVILSAWSGLLINAINCIPIGEIDGGRIAQALWGRKGWSRFTGVSIALLGLTGIFSDVALYWVVLVVFLQRGPIAPLADEVTPPSSKHIVAGVSALLLSLLVCCPFPFLFA